MRHFSGEFEGIRLLMLDELDAIAGGEGEDTDDGSGGGSAPGDDIVVNGHTYSGQILFAGLYNSGIYVGSIDNGSGGGGENKGTVDHQEDDDCQDGEAVHIAEHIKGLVAQGSNYEYSTLIVKNANGTYGANNDQLTTIYSPTFSALDVPADYSQVFGMIHNHPFSSSDYNFNFQQRFPSDDDWDALDLLVSRGTPAASLSMYIVDPFGSTREFHYSDKDMFKSMSYADRAQVNSSMLPPETVDCTP